MDLRAVMLFRSGGIIPKATSLADQLKTLESVIGAYAVFGRFDIVAFLEAKDTKTLFKAVSDATRLEGIMSSETLIEVTANGESLDYGKGPPFSN